MTLGLRALLAFLTLPFVVAGVVPLLLARLGPAAGAGSPLALVPFAVGLAIVQACVRDFLLVGRGTLAPWDPPDRLVVVGFYRWVRNPMYLGVLGVLAGWAVATGSGVLWAYLAAVALGFHLRVVLAEEPALQKRFGSQWTAYARNVHRWIPRPPRRVPAPHRAPQPTPGSPVDPSSPGQSGPVRG